MKKQVFIILIITSFVFASCNSEHEYVQKEPVKPQNYIVLLDLSDRLLSPNQFEQDIDLIFSVFKKFEENVRRNLVINSKDKFRVVIAPQKGIKYDKFKYEGQLYLDMNIIPVNEKVSGLEAFRAEMKAALNNLYPEAVQGENPSDYQGCDIWKYFNEQLASDIEIKAENYLVVLTDGYFDFESYSKKKQIENRYSSTRFFQFLRTKADWKGLAEDKDYGLIPVDKDFDHLRVCIMEITPKYENLDEADMLIYTWSKWLKEMNIINFSTILHGSKPKCIGQLADFLNP